MVHKGGFINYSNTLNLKCKEEPHKDWSQLPDDVLGVIAAKVDNLRDSYHFSEVCTSWYLAARQNRRHLLPHKLFPLLMVPQFTEKRDTRRLLHCEGSPSHLELEDTDQEDEEQEEEEQEEQEEEEEVEVQVEEEEEDNDDDATEWEKKIEKMQLLVPHDQVCVGTAYGWLFLVDDNLDTKLLDPISRAEIQLPPVTTLAPRADGRPHDKWSICKAVFSSSPSVESTPVVLVIYSRQAYRSLAFCKPGDKVWTTIKEPHFTSTYVNDDSEWPWLLSSDTERYMDAIYYKKQFYIVTFRSDTLVYDIDSHTGKYALSQVIPFDECIKYVNYRCRKYLVELDGDLLQLDRQLFYTRNNYDFFCDDYVHHDEDFFDRDGNLIEVRHYTRRFRIHRLNECGQKWVELKSLGDNSLFVGHNTSFSLRSTDYPNRAFRSCVYFTDDEEETATSPQIGYDMGIYSLEKGYTVPVYMDDLPLTSPSPFWFTPSFR